MHDIVLGFSSQSFDIVHPDTQSPNFRVIYSYDVVM